jgi:uncharacterized caspase-like protein
MRGFDRRFWLTLFASLWMSVVACAAQGAAEALNPRLALVIGAASYADAKLATLVNDASLIAEVLKSAGFDVTGAANPDQNQLRQLLREFLRKAEAAGPDMQAFVYFAGRAIQYDGDNYLVPVDAHIARASDAPLEAVRLSDFTHGVTDAQGLARVIIIDGARANPYAREGRPLAGGLAAITPAPGSIIAFNAAPGAIGAEPSGPYDVYAKELADQLRQGGVPIDDVFDRTRLAVNQATGGAVAPWSASKLSEPYYLLARATDAAPSGSNLPALSTPLKTLSPAEAYDLAVLRDTLQGYEEFLAAFPNAPQAARVRAMLAARREALIWRRTRDFDTVQAYWTYLKFYPRGPHAGDAARALEELGAAATPPRDFQPVDYGDLGSPSPGELSFAQGGSFYIFSGALGPPPAAPLIASLPEENFDWQNIPAPQTSFDNSLPALPFIIPLLPHSHRFHHHRPTGDGRENEAPPPETQAAKPAPSNAGGTTPRGSAATRIAPLTAHPPLTAIAPGYGVARQSTGISQWRPTLHSAPVVATPIQPHFYLAPGLAPAPLARPVPFVSLPRPVTPVFHAAPAPAPPHFAAPHFAAPAPAGRL